MLGEDGLTILPIDNWPPYKEFLPVLVSAQFIIGEHYCSSVSYMTMRTPVILTEGNMHKFDGLGQLVLMRLSM